MKNVIGSYKKSIAGIVCAIGLFLFSAFSFAEDPSANREGTNASGNAQSPPSNSQTSAQSSSQLHVDTSISPINTSVIDQANTENISTAPVVSLALTPPKPVTPSVKTNTTSQLASVVGGLVVILLLIYGLSWFVKRFSQGGFMQNPSMKIVSSMPLGTRERLMLIDVGGKQLLLGVTPTHINTLHVFDEPVIEADKPQSASSEFSQKLMAILQQKNMTPNGNSHKN